MSAYGSLVLSLDLKNRLATDFGERAGDTPYSVTKALTDGVAANQIQKVFFDTRTLAASANEDLDLNGSTLQDTLGANLALTSVKLIVIKAADGNTNNVVYKPAAANGFLGPLGAAANTITLLPGQVVVLTNFSAAGWTVTPGTADLINLANSGAGTTVTYDLLIAGF